MNTKTQSALRATLKNEDAALDRRLPDAPSAKPAPRKRAAPTSPKRTGTPASETAAQAKARSTPAAQAGTKSAARKTASPRATTPAQKRPSRAVKTPAAPPAGNPTPASANPPPESPATKAATKSQKRVREEFSLVGSDLERLDQLKALAAVAGRKITRSQLVRAGVLLLAQRDINTVTALIDGLPGLRKGKKK